MLVEELIAHLMKMDGKSIVKLEVKSKIDEEDEMPTLSSIDSIEFNNEKVTLKGYDELVEWD